MGRGFPPPLQRTRSGGASFGPPAGPGAEPQPQTILKHILESQNGSGTGKLVWMTGRLMSPDRGFGTSCLLHCGHLTVTVNSEDS